MAENSVSHQGTLNGDNKILLAHGGGGRLTQSLIEKYILPKFSNDTLDALTDSACLELPGGSSGKVCFTTDSYVIKPIFFNGGDIGKLAVCGTVNDLAVCGANPIALSLGLIIEEGFELAKLERILQSIADAASQAGVKIVTGDTKGVEKGSADGIFINTAGVGIRKDNINLSVKNICSGDKIIITGTIGDHGMTIISQREGIKFESQLQSDCAALNSLIFNLLDNFASDIKFMRDPTRGGLAATLNEIARQCLCSIEIFETAIPAARDVRAAADMLGFDLLNIANEGKAVIAVSAEKADAVVELCRQNPLGKNAAVIGEIAEKADKDDLPIVEMITAIGGRRIVQMPYGRELPRIC